jgi:hypothetical protein
MPHQDECPAIDNFTALLIEYGPATMASDLAMLVNHAMLIKREQIPTASLLRVLLTAKPTPTDCGRRFPRPTSAGQTCRCRSPLAYRDENGRPFYPRSLERGVRSGRAPNLAVAEMYVQGLSTPKSTTVVQ